MRDDSPTLIATRVNDGCANDPQRLPLPPLESVDSANVTDINIITTNDSETTINKNAIDESMNHDFNNINTCQSIKNKNVEMNMNSNENRNDDDTDNKESYHDHATTVCDNHPQAPLLIEREDNTQSATWNVMIKDKIHDQQNFNTCTTAVVASNCINSINTDTNTKISINTNTQNNYTNTTKYHLFRLPIRAARQSCMVKQRDSNYSDINRINYVLVVLVYYNVMKEFI